jgi:hypothetical protein
MIDYAAAAVPEMRPDAYVVAYITNDLVRPRFWLLERQIGGRERLLLSRGPAEEGATDYLQINPRITRAWCERMAAAKASGDRAALREDPVAADLLQQRRDLLAGHGQPLFRVDLRSLRRSFAFNRIVLGNAFHNVPLGEARGSYERIGFTSFGEDSRFREAIGRLEQTGIPGYLVHIPHQFEIIAGREFDYTRAGGSTDAQGASLRRSLETLMGVPSIPLLKHLGSWRAEPAAHIWKPDDHHPNRKGIEVLSKAVTEALIEQGIAKLARR